tara:strand:+ start:249 stop:410 length:162 start_codon:yes stop_codon:yes gene_type:complete
MLIVKAKIKETCQGFNVSSDVAVALNVKCEELLKAACKRAEGNSRRTVMAKDL